MVSNEQDDLHIMRYKMILMDMCCEVLYISNVSLNLKEENCFFLHSGLLRIHMQTNFWS